MIRPLKLLGNRSGSLIIEMKFGLNLDSPREKVMEPPVSNKWALHSKLPVWHLCDYNQGSFLTLVHINA